MRPPVPTRAYIWTRSLAVGLRNRARTAAEDLAGAVRLLRRGAGGEGEHTSLDDVITTFGFTRAELEEELAREAGGATGVGK